MSKAEQPAILGLWDLRAQAPGLGNLIILVEEMLVRAEQSGGGVEGLCFVVGGSHGPVRRAEAGAVPFGQILEAFKAIDRLYLAPDLNAVREFAGQHPGAFNLWPELKAEDSRGFLAHTYGDSRFLQQYCRERGRIPFVGMKAPHVRWALDLYDRRIAPRLPIVVHLKNVAGCPDESNANFDAWHAFLDACRGRADVAFVLIGNEPVDERILGLPNVVTSRSAGAVLAGDLALVQTAFAYMGMAAGPCAMAMFGPAPYLVFKNPVQHADQMKLELGTADHFAFARPGQKILRVRETRDSLLDEFEMVMSSARRSDWEERLGRLRAETGSTVQGGMHG